ncbi:hypothetical protein Ancab_001489, partial [Ancistrocladus abbreviatus]
RLHASVRLHAQHHPQLITKLSANPIHTLLHLQIHTSPLPRPSDLCISIPSCQLSISRSTIDPPLPLQFLHHFYRPDSDCCRKSASSGGINAYDNGNRTLAPGNPTSHSRTRTSPPPPPPQQ